MTQSNQPIDTLSPEKVVLLAGPTASGKSALSLEIASLQGRTIVNADALQVYGDWPILTAQPSAEEQSRVPHALYGHVAYDAPYSVGRWLREVTPLLTERPAPVVVGGTGLYFRALTEGLAEIPATDPAVRAIADTRMATEGREALVSELDEAARLRIDTRNPKRVQRAWEVLHQTRRGLADWQDQTGPPILPVSAAEALFLAADRTWLADRIDRRFDQMVDMGALDEARAMIGRWNPTLQSSQAIGAKQMIAALKGEIPLSEAIERAKIASRQYAKRQRTWFRNRMKSWQEIAAESA